jgi:hypothetical protein
MPNGPLLASNPPWVGLSQALSLSFKGAARGLSLACEPNKSDLMKSNLTDFWTRRHQGSLALLVWWSRARALAKAPVSLPPPPGGQIIGLAAVPPPTGALARRSGRGTAPGRPGRIGIGVLRGLEVPGFATAPPGGVNHWAGRGAAADGRVSTSLWPVTPAARSECAARTRRHDGIDRFGPLRAHLDRALPAGTAPGPASRAGAANPGSATNTRRSRGQSAADTCPFAVKTRRAP